MTHIVNKYKAKYDVYIGRRFEGDPGYFGNPFILGVHGNREEVIRKFTEYFYKRLVEDKEFYRKVHTLKGKTLACYCKPLSCHGDVIAKYLDGS